MRALAGFFAFQVAWWGTALLAADHHPWLAALPALAYIALEVLRAPGRRAAIAVLATAAATSGAVVDTALAASGAVSFLDDAQIVPPFLPALWAAFACTFTSSLAWLTRPGARTALFAAVVGAVGGALAYRGAASLGVLVTDGARSLVLIGAAWSVATPALASCARLLLRPEWARRARTIPRLVAIAALLVACAPALFAVGITIDVLRFAVARTPFMSVRLAAFALVYVVGEIVGLFRLLLAGSSVEHTYRIQLWWTGALFRVVCALFRLRVVVEGDECVSPGAVFLVRHASIIDTLLPSVLITGAHGVKLRFVVKRELLEDPCLDIAGHRLQNHFVARGGADTEADLAAVRALAAGLKDDEGLLIYPEGTRFTAKKRAHAIAALEERDALLAERARAMTHVLPPKPAGVGALLDGRPSADVIFVAHAGLERFAHVADVWSGALLGRTVRVRMWRVPRADVPDDDAARTAWLYTQWQSVDRFVSEALT